MELLKDSLATVFDTDVVKVGGFLRCKAVGWEDYKNCLVTSIKPEKIIAMTLTPPHTVTFIKIPVADVDAGLWEIFYSNDLEAITHVEINP